MQFRNLSIRLKLIVLLGASAAIALLISAVMSLTLTYKTQRDESLRNLHQMANIASENITAALAFRDSASARRMLGALHTNPHILAAVIRDDSALEFATYVAPLAAIGVQARYLPELIRLAEAQHSALFEARQALASITPDYMYVIVPIMFEGNTIGTLILLSDKLALWDRINYFILMQALISVVTLALIALISIKLQKVFTTPIFHIIDTIREISETKNYAVSVDTIQNDEFKVLYAHFNTMIAEINRRDALLSRLATTDPLTGLANRRHAMEVMQTMVTRARRKQEFFGLAMFDIDHFKSVNDQYGHPVGDLVLKQVAAVLTHTTREYDLVARIGGEEFLVLCDHSNQEDTRLIAERMRQAIEDVVIRYDGDRILRVTASAGVYAQTPSSEDLQAPLSRVDSALYHAKQTGRNKVSVWEKS